MNDFMNPATLIVFGGAIAFVPTLLVLTTSFVKVSIILNILRNAFGANQVPPGYVINAIAGAVTVFIMAGTISEAIGISRNLRIDYADLNSVGVAIGAVANPFITFMKKNTDAQEALFFAGLREDLWNDSARSFFAGDSIMVVAPAFILSEVKKAFEIGFLLYIPFILIDVVVSSIIVSVGLSSVSPNIITIPIKFLLFVHIDGWNRLVDSLIRSYTP